MRMMGQRGSRAWARFEVRGSRFEFSQPETRTPRLKTASLRWLLIVTVTSVLLGFAPMSRAASGLDKQLQEGQQELKQLKGQLKGYQTRLDRTRQRERTIVQEIEETEGLLQQKKRELQTQERTLKGQAEKYAMLTKKMEELTQELRTREEFLHKRLRALYKQGRLAYLPFLLSAADVSDFVERVRFTTKIVQHDAQLLQQHRFNLAALEQTRRGVKEREEHLASAKLRVAAKKEEIEKERLKKNKLLTRIKEEQGAYESAMRDLEQASTRLVSLITDFERQRKRGSDRLAREQRQAPTRATPRIPSPSGESDSATKGMFAGLRGKLPWPVEGKIISIYGKSKHPTFNTYTFNKGIGIGAPLGSDFRVIDAGEVLYADWFKGYGNLLIVDHGDSYYSLYANAAELLVKVGTKVKRHQTVGKTGESGSGSLNGPALYFEIRHHGKPENPIEWLVNHRQQR